MLKELLDSVSCPSCGSDAYKIMKQSSYPENMSKEELLSVYHSSSDTKLLDQLVCCNNCDLVYLSPRISENIIMESYESAEDAAFIEENSFRIKTFKKSIQYLSTNFDFPLSSNTRVLDIGCAGGAFVKAADDLGLDVVGIEPSRWLAKLSKETYDVDIRPGVLEDQDFIEKSFDVITLWDVIEHLTHPDEVIEQVSRLLKDDGILIINYPDHGSIARKLLKFNWPFYLSVHLIYFDRKTIVEYLGKHGFETVGQKPYFQTLSLAYVFSRAANYFKFFSIFEKFTKLIRIGNLPLKYNMGQTLLVARKAKKK